MKITGVMGSGLVGVDPYDENAWSGSSRFLFQECERQGVLNRAFGVDAVRLFKYPLMLRNFSFDRKLWAQKFYLDTSYFSLLSAEIAGRLSEFERIGPILQLGGIYNLREYLGHKAYLSSYHDGNLAEAVRSPNFPSGISTKAIDKALAYERRVYEGLDRIFVMSEYLKRSFVQDFGVPDTKVEVIGAGINMGIPPEPIGKNYATKKLLFLGADFDRKGGWELLAAFKILKGQDNDAELHIVGPRRLSIPSELSDGVHWHGFLSKNSELSAAKLKSLFQQTSLFVLPSKYEPFGIAPLEAMANRIPCLLIDRWAFPDMVTSGVNGELVSDHDPERMAAAMGRLLGDPTRLEAMGLAARNLALERFTWPAVVARLRRSLEAEIPELQTR
ncbi:MAG: glycosyltransferase family 4 protein [Burkholderiales bacterium]|nr:glycosyltransferase family 4 protein [Burkholderiales bacterium]